MVNKDYQRRADNYYDFFLLSVSRPPCMHTAGASVKLVTGPNTEHNTTNYVDA